MQGARTWVSRSRVTCTASEPTRPPFGPNRYSCPRKGIAVVDNGLATGRQSHEIYLVQNGQRRWIPDLWTMQQLNLSPADLQIVDDDELTSLPQGDAIAATVPPPSLDGVAYVESDSGVFKVVNGRLQPMSRDEAALVAAQHDDTQALVRSVVYLPMSVLRGLI